MMSSASHMPQTEPLVIFFYQRLHSFIYPPLLNDLLSEIVRFGSIDIY